MVSAAFAQSVGVVIVKLDPRPDLQDDHAITEAVLQTALELGKRKVYTTLLGMRCVGLSFYRGPASELRMNLAAVLEDCQMTKAEFATRWLTPILQDLNQVLAKARERIK